MQEYRLIKPLYVQEVSPDAEPQGRGEKTRITAGEVLQVNPTDFATPAQMISVTYKGKTYITDKRLLRSSVS